jgi:putative heme-binding domain-containing protein
MSLSSVRVLVAVLFVAPAGLHGQDAAPEHARSYEAADVRAGATLYGRLCVNCHGVSGTGVGGIDLRRGVLPRASTDEALRAVIANGFPQAGMPAFRLEPAEARALVAFLRAGFEVEGEGAEVALGDAGRGRLVFEGKGQCLSCHRRDYEGSFAGPDLTDVGRSRIPASLRQSLLDPSSAMRPIHRPVRAVTSDGRLMAGRRLNEDTYTVQLMTAEGRLVSLVKSELREWSVSLTSSMPSYADRLAPEELADLVAYLVSLKGQ